MTIEKLIEELNDQQKIAATFRNEHALVLAGAGCGKTKTIIARTAFLISNGTPPHRIQILTFTRRAAAEIIERVRLHLGPSADGLKAFTFHTWCLSLIRRAPKAFGYKNHSVIDRDDQLQLFKFLRGKNTNNPLPSAQRLCDLYSYARNTGLSLSETLKKNEPENLEHKSKIAEIMLGYESKKKERRYIDYDDILDIVAQTIKNSPEICSWLSSQYDHILIDEMQDTNPLQWKIIDPLKSQVKLFCVGDDAQSIYGFRGADFKNIHQFSERVIGSHILKLENNYRSTQEILDLSNWLLSESPLNYNKKLVSIRGQKKELPQLHTFLNEWEEGRWIAEDLLTKKAEGKKWSENMVLVRSTFAARVIESCLLSKDIPYKFIGGTKLLDAAHVKDLLSVLRIVGNHQDEIGWMRFLTLWSGIGEVTANKIIEIILKEESISNCITSLRNQEKIPAIAIKTIQTVIEYENQVDLAIKNSYSLISSLLSEKYKNQDWEKRKNDFRLLEKISHKHTSILQFIEEYLLDPISVTEVEKNSNDDAVIVITIHSAKGTESPTCYVVNASPGSYPSKYAQGDIDEVEEERRVLYVALTRAKNELIITRHGFSFWAQTTQSVEASQDAQGEKIELYFLENLPENLTQSRLHQKAPWTEDKNQPENRNSISLGISMD